MKSTKHPAKPGQRPNPKDRFFLPLRNYSPSLVGLSRSRGRLIGEVLFPDDYQEYCSFSFRQVGKECEIQIGPRTELFERYADQARNPVWIRNEGRTRSTVRSSWTENCDEDEANQNFYVLLLARSRRGALVGHLGLGISAHQDLDRNFMSRSTRNGRNSVETSFGVFLGSIFIRPAFRGQGYANALVSVAAAIASDVFHSFCRNLPRGTRVDNHVGAQPYSLGGRACFLNLLNSFSSEVQSTQISAKEEFGVLVRDTEDWED